MSVHCCQVEQCVSDPAAVILEGARKFPPVLGINPFVYREDKEFTVGNGRTVKETAGQFGLVSYAALCITSY